MVAAWVSDRLSKTEWSMLIVFVTAFTIPFMTGLFGITYAQASGTVAVLALSYLLYRAVIYRSYKYVRGRASDSAA